MNNKDFAPSLVSYCLLSYISAPACPTTPHPSLSTPLPHFSLRGLLHAVSPHTCWTVPMLCPLPSCLLGWWRSLARPPAREDRRPVADKERETGDGAPQWGAVYSTHYVFIRIADVFDPIPALPLSSSAAFIALFFFFLFVFGSKKYLRL